MECENMRVPELKALARERRLRGYSRMRKTELVALIRETGAKALQNSGTPEGPRVAAPHIRPPPPPPQRCAAYVTLKFGDNLCCRIHRAKRGEASVSDADEEIVTNERYVVMPWKMVNVDGKS